VAESIARLTRYLDGLGARWELVMVDDGSRDGTGDVIDAHADGVRVIAVRLPANRGKGRAVSAGMLRARGACRIFTDADLPYRLGAIELCAELVRGGSLAAFGNRRLNGSDSSAQPWVRRAIGRVVQSLVGLLLGRSDVDTQCGFKGFAGPAADVLFADLRIDGFLFDVEISQLLVRAGVRIDFIPVVLLNRGATTVRLLPTALRSLSEGWRIFKSRGGSADRVRALRELYLRSNT
jgi:glycosyltransferase involved in cell wall biosynthesis